MLKLNADFNGSKYSRRSRFQKTFGNLLIHYVFLCVHCAVYIPSKVCEKTQNAGLTIRNMLQAKALYCD